jgi:hypothetical protein
VDVVDLLLIAAGAMPIVAARDLRTARAAAFVVILAGIPLAAGGLPEPGQGAVKIAAVWTYIVVFLWFQHLLAGRTAAEGKLDRELRRIASDADALARAWPADALTARASRELILGRIGALEPPNQMWSLVVALHRSYYSLLLPAPEGYSAPTTRPNSAADLAQVREELVLAWEQALRPGKHDRERSQ